jgi:hypothetical protein
MPDAARAWSQWILTLVSRTAQLGRRLGTTAPAVTGPAARHACNEPKLPERPNGPLSTEAVASGGRSHQQIDVGRPSNNRRHGLFSAWKRPLGSSPPGSSDGTGYGRSPLSWLLCSEQGRFVKTRSAQTPPPRRRLPVVGPSTQDEGSRRDAGPLSGHCAVTFRLSVLTLTGYPLTRSRAADSPSLVPCEFTTKSL